VKREGRIDCEERDKAPEKARVKEGELKKGDIEEKLRRKLGGDLRDWEFSMRRHSNERETGSIEETEVLAAPLRHCISEPGAVVLGLIARARIPAIAATID
jgi:hypothetical protein